MSVCLSVCLSFLSFRAITAEPIATKYCMQTPITSLIAVGAFVLRKDIVRVTGTEHSRVSTNIWANVGTSHFGIQVEHNR